MFGGTPCDASVLQAIARLKALGQSVMFYPFILMDIQAGNGLARSLDRRRRPAARFRGAAGSRSTTAPGRAGSADKTAAAADGGRRLLRHGAAVGFRASTATGSATTGRRSGRTGASSCTMRISARVAGGVGAFCIGSEMRSLTQIRDGARSYPAVRALRRLAEDVRVDPRAGRQDRLCRRLVGVLRAPAGRRVGRRALSPRSALGASRHRLRRHRQLHAAVGLARRAEPRRRGGRVDLRSRVSEGQRRGRRGLRLVLCRRGRARRAGPAADQRRRLRRALGFPLQGPGELVVEAARQPARRGEGGRRRRSGSRGRSRSGSPSSAARRSNKGTNQPNVFHDPKSSESFFPYHSNGSQDDFIQYRYLQAMFAHWSDPANNPRVGPLFGPHGRHGAGACLGLGRAAVARLSRTGSRPGSDGDNHARGHWLNGRTSLAALAEVVAEICARCDLTAIDVGRLHGGVTGYPIEAVESGRQSLQPLMLAYGVRQLRDRRRSSPSRAAAVRRSRAIEPDRCVAVSGQPVVSRTRAPLGGDGRAASRSGSSAPTATTRRERSEARAPDARGAEDRADRASGRAQRRARRGRSPGGRCAESGIARDTVRLSLPASRLRLTPGDMVAVGRSCGSLPDRSDRGVAATGRFRRSAWSPTSTTRRRSRSAGAREGLGAASSPVEVVFLDLPLLTGEESPHSPHVAVVAKPWTGAVAVYSANQDHGYRFIRNLRRPATLGALLEPLPAGRPGAVDALLRPRADRVGRSAEPEPRRRC